MGYYVIAGRPYWDGVPFTPALPQGTGPSGTKALSGNRGPLMPAMNQNGLFKEFGYRIDDTTLWPTDVDSDAIIANFPNNIFMDFGSSALGLGDNLAYNVVSHDESLVPVLSNNPAIADYTLAPANPTWSCVEGMANNTLPPPGTLGDHHGIWAQLQADGVSADALYEMYKACYDTVNHRWNPNAACKWDPKVGTPRINSASSTDAAGLPIGPLLCTYPEVATGAINHALRFVCVAPTSAMKAYVWPARSWSNGRSFGMPVSGQPEGRPYNWLPTGGRIRLKASFDLSPYSGQILVILTALKRYGGILADYGAGGTIKYNMGFTGVTHDLWNDPNLQLANAIPCSAFEVVKLTPIFTGVPSATTMNLGDTIQLTFTRTMVNSAGFSIFDPTFSQRFYLSDNNRANFAVCDFTPANPGPNVVAYKPTQAGQQKIVYGSGLIMGLNAPLMHITVN